ncbi:TetR/AcrR family transcriptional regulator [Telmatospirillum sp.]|uniref:TetR/AcrR family transcriptional regulator n=1 Tax=Telmatospirillum sp. TaxID=2079197 RepID=UPI002842AF43|nr:TetR/AcrR family transcriptional regulator [Telmatospirillum sp.]MDR3438636.1 TetR/AcrR family transcriptional regulator [Telmatospirillum sp.]
MTTAYNRKKQPEAVRRALLDCATKLAGEWGLTALTVQAVADAAGVTKGGLFHHFPNKQALIDAVAADLLDQFDAEIDAYMAKDDHPYGRFTRAYVEANFNNQGFGIGSPMAAMAISLITNPDMNRAWLKWLAERLRRHYDTDNAPILEIVRLAADGAWTAHLMGAAEVLSTSPDDLRLRLLALTLDN